MKFSKDFKLKLRRFKSDKRAYTSFLILLFLFLATLPAELICNVRPILLVVDGKAFFPIFIDYSERDFGGVLPSEPDYKSADFIRLLEGTPEPETDKSSLPIIDEDGDPAFSLDVGDFEEDAVEPSFDIDLDDFEEEADTNQAS
jgi:hypothetical protein